MNKRTLLYRYCGAEHTGGSSWEMYWDHEARTHVRVNILGGNTCQKYFLLKGTLIDSWCSGTTHVLITTTWDGTGRPPMHYKYGEDHTDEIYHTEEVINSGSCAESVCGLKITDVQVSGSGAEYIITIFTSGYAGAIEYSLNNFVDVQDSNVFRVEPGKFKAYARAKR